LLFDTVEYLLECVRVYIHECSIPEWLIRNKKNSCVCKDTGTMLFVNLVTLSRSAGIHTKAALAGFVLLVVFSFTSLQFSKLSGALLRNSADIGVEHQSPLSLYVEVGRLSNSAMVDMYSDANETVKISVSSEWTLREVRNATVADIVSDEPTFGFTRWSLPPNAGVSFYVPNYPEAVMLHNPSGVQMKVNITHIDIEAQTVERNVLLVTDNSVTLY